MARLQDELTGHQRATQAAIAAVREAAAGVLVDAAADLIAELEAGERRAALVRGQLVALQRHFELEGHRGSPTGVYAARIGRAMPKGPFELRQEAVNEAVTRWARLSDKLFNDVNAELQELKS
jgi:hypothetical protein